jgi:hypothetical protein
LSKRKTEMTLRVWHLAVGAVAAVALGAFGVTALQHRGTSSSGETSVKVQVSPFGSSETAGSAARHEASDVLALLKARGLPISGYVRYTAATDENHLLGRPGQYVSKLNFKDTRIPTEESLGDPTSIDAGGSIETFTNEADAKKRLAYVSAITQSVQFAAEYEYRVGTVLLRVSNVLTPDQARAYGQALRDAVG